MIDTPRTTGSTSRKSRGPRNARPLDRARFLAIRDGFRETTSAQNGVEAALLDTAAAAFNDFLHWTEQGHMQAGSETAIERDSLERHGEWSPPRLSAVEAIEQTAKMAERAHKRLLQTVKLLHDLQRTSATVYVSSASQVNIGGPQVNVASPARGRRWPNDLPKSSGRSKNRRRIVPTRQVGRVR